MAKKEMNVNELEEVSGGANGAGKVNYFRVGQTVRGSYNGDQVVITIVAIKGNKSQGWTYTVKVKSTLYEGKPEEIIDMAEDLIKMIGRVAGAMLG